MNKKLKKQKMDYTTEEENLKGRIKYLESVLGITDGGPARSKEDLIRFFQKEIMKENTDKPCGAQRDIVVYINHSVPEEYTIELIQQIEKAIDVALSYIGFGRSISCKGDVSELVYWQFACVGKKDSNEQG